MEKSTYQQLLNSYQQNSIVININIVQAHRVIILSGKNCVLNCLGIMEKTSYQQISLTYQQKIETYEQLLIKINKLSTFF